MAEMTTGKDGVGFRVQLNDRDKEIAERHGIPRYEENGQTYVGYRLPREAAQNKVEWFNTY